MFHKYNPSDVPVDAYEDQCDVTFEKRKFTTPDDREVYYVTLKIKLGGVNVYFKPCVGHNAQALKEF